jgi:uncharacterized spore protein YtfJ
LLFALDFKISCCLKRNGLLLYPVCFRLRFFLRANAATAITMMATTAAIPIVISVGKVAVGSGSGDEVGVGESDAVGDAVGAGFGEGVGVGVGLSSPTKG